MTRQGPTTLRNLTVKPAKALRTTPTVNEEMEEVVFLKTNDHMYRFGLATDSMM